MASSLPETPGLGLHSKRLLEGFRLRVGCEIGWPPRGGRSRRSVESSTPLSSRRISCIVIGDGGDLGPGMGLGLSDRQPSGAAGVGVGEQSEALEGFDVFLALDEVEDLAGLDGRLNRLVSIGAAAG